MNDGHNLSYNTHARNNIYRAFMTTLFVQYNFISAVVGRDDMVVGFTTTCAISAYHHYHRGFEYCSWRGVFDTTLCDKVRQ